MLELDPRFMINPKKVYIGFNIVGKNGVNAQPKAAKILLDILRVRPQDLNDPEKKTRYMNHSYDWVHQHVTQFEIKNEDDVECAIVLAKQGPKRFFNKLWSCSPRVGHLKV